MPPRVTPWWLGQVYTDSQWGDLLTSYDGTAITYDAIGNPLSYYNGSVYTFTWTGRQLTSAVKGSKTMSFTYDDAGIRTGKTVNNVKHTYYLNGSLIMAEEWEDKILLYLYDSAGAPIGMMYRKTSYDVEQWDAYWFEKNLQGDVIKVYNNAGNEVASYSYKDAWGNHSYNYTNLSSNEGVQYNPFRYRGYYYDIDLEMYYLQSRYYDSKICRFINADSALYGSMLGNNLFAYCENNPVTRIDPTGKLFEYNINFEDDFCLEGAGAGGFGASGNYFGYGTAYYNYSVYSSVASYNAGLCGYHFGGGGYIGGSTAQYAIGTVSVNDSMATNRRTVQTTSNSLDTTTIHGNSLQSTKTNYGYALVDSSGNILKFGETINPATRYSKSYLLKNNATMMILISGSKIDIHLWQHDMNEYYYYRYGVYPPLNKRGW